MTQAIHPAGSGVSVLEHLLGEHATIPGSGLFLEHSFRMHPDVCRYISHAFYAGRLESAAALAVRGRDGAPLAGGRARGQPHVVRRGGSGDRGGDRGARPLARGCDGRGASNMQVRLLARELPGVRVGTVDKFQGQEAPVVFF